jgi:hypothetical protein
MCSLAKFNLLFRGDIASFFKVEQQAKHVTRQNAVFHKAGNESDFLDFSYLVKGRLMSSCEHCKEVSSSIKGAKYIAHMIVCWLLRKTSVIFS